MSQLIKFSLIPLLGGIMIGVLLMVIVNINNSPLPKMRDYESYSFDYVCTDQGATFESEGKTTNLSMSETGKYLHEEQYFSVELTCLKVDGVWQQSLTLKYLKLGVTVEALVHYRLIISVPHDL